MKAFLASAVLLVLSCAAAISGEQPIGSARGTVEERRLAVERMADRAAALKKKLDDQHDFDTGIALYTLVFDLIAALKDPDREVRFAAAVALAHCAPDQAGAATNILVDRLEDTDRKIRRTAVLALRHIGARAKAALPVLTRLLGDTDGELRASAAFLLGKIGPPAREGLPILLVLLKDADSRVRVGAAFALGRVAPQNKRVADALTGALRDRGRLVRGAAADTLGEMAPALARHAAARLVHLLADTDADVRAVAAKSLGAIGYAARESIPALEKALKDPADNVRVAAALALAGMGSAARGTVPSLAAALEDDEPQVRAFTAAALGEIGPPARPAIPALAAALKRDYDPTVLQKIAAALEQFGPAAREAVPTLTGLLDSPVRDVRSSAAAALAKMGAAARPAVPRLIRLAIEEDDNQLDATWALGAILPATRAALAPLHAALHDANPKRRRGAVAALGRLAHENTHALPLLVATLQDTDGDVRAVAVSGLSYSSPTGESVNLLVHMLTHDAEEKVRERAASALGWLGPAAGAAAVPLAVALQKGNQEAAWALGRLGPEAKKAVPVLVAILKNYQRAKTAGKEVPIMPGMDWAAPERPWDYAIMLDAVWAIEKIGPPAREAVPHLLAVLQREPDQRHLRISVACAVAHGDPRRALDFIPMLVQEIQRRGDSRLRALHALRHIGPPARTELVRALVTEMRADEILRPSHVRELGLLGAAASETIPELIDLLRGDRNILVRVEAARAVMRIDPASKAVRAALKDALWDPAVDVRLTAHAALARIDPRRRKATVTMLCANLLDADEPITNRRSAGWALKDLQTSDDMVLAALIKCLADPEPNIRWVAARVLEHLGPAARKAVPALRQYRQSGNRYAREVADDALRAIGVEEHRTDRPPKN